MESAREAGLRAVQGLCDEIMADALRADDRLVLDRILARDEEGRPRLVVVEELEDASERAERGVF